MTFRDPRRKPATRLAAGVVWIAAICAGAGLSSGCATKPATAQEELAVWLSEAPRTVAVKVAPTLPPPAVRVRDHKVGERVLKGTSTAVYSGIYTVGRSCGAGTAGCVVGLVAAPFAAAIGGVVGAASVDSIDRMFPIGEAGGASELYATTVRSHELSALLTSAVVAKAKGRRHALHAHALGEAVADGTLELAFAAIDLAGQTGQDPRVHLIVEVDASLASSDVSATWARLVYKGWPRAVSEWKASEGALFRAELEKAIDVIAGEVAPRLEARPPLGAAMRTKESRRLRAERLKQSGSLGQVGSLIVSGARVAVWRAAQLRLLGEPEEAL